MAKLSVNKIKADLLEADEARKVKYERMKSTTSPKAKEFGKPSDPSTRITKVKQITVPSSSEPKESKGKMGIVPAGKDARDIVDAMGIGIFGSTKSDSKNPRSVPVKSMGKPNQATKQTEVSAKTNEDKSMKMNIVPAGKDARDIVDAMDRGIHKNKSKKDGEMKVPSSETKPKGAATTAPKAKEKKADMDRNPTVNVKDPVAPKKDFPMPSDAPSKPSWQKVKGGVIVEVNGKHKAKLDIVSERVLDRMVENYQSVGYKVTLKTTADVSWKKDKVLFDLIRESIDAKWNRVPQFAKDFRKNAFKRFYECVKTNMNGLYESRDEFLAVVREGFKNVESAVEKRYLAGLEIFEGILRVKTNEGLEDIEIMTEATDPMMAARNVRDKVFEEYGMGVEIKHIFLDGKKVNMSRIVEWGPQLDEEIPDFIQKKIDAKKKKADEKKGKKVEEAGTKCSAHGKENCSKCKCSEHNKVDCSKCD